MTPLFSQEAKKDMLSINIAHNGSHERDNAIKLSGPQLEAEVQTQISPSPSVVAPTHSLNSSQSFSWGLGEIVFGLLFIFPVVLLTWRYKLHQGQ